MGNGGSPGGNDASPAGNARPKVVYVETLRGVACLLLVSYHVIGDTSLHGLELPPEHPFSFWNRMFSDVRMPMFSFISGFVFSAYASDLIALRGKVFAKVRRLLIPMVVVASLFYWTQAAFAPQPEGPVPYWRLFVLPYQHYWYLQATFLLMLAVFLLTYVARKDGTRAAALLLPVCCVAAIAGEQWRPDVFSSYEAVYLAPYFLGGYLISHVARLRTAMDAVHQRPRLLGIVVPLLGLLCCLEFLLQKDLLTLGGPERHAVGLVVGLSTCLFLFALRFRSRLLAFVGDRSYAIYLFHVFFTAGSRIVLERLMPGMPVPLLFTIGLVAGVAGPILVSWLAAKTPVTSLLLLGIRKRAGGQAAGPALTGSRSGTSVRPDDASVTAGICRMD
jgi:peptidoglycan/LPS O-acetylase OafA/YrhL